MSGVHLLVYLGGIASKGCAEVACGLPPGGDAGRTKRGFDRASPRPQVDSAGLR